MKLSFTKMHGCGNNYIYINCFDQKVTDPEKLSIALSEPHFGIGGDGISLISPSDRADAQMRIFNGHSATSMANPSTPVTPSPASSTSPASPPFPKACGCTD